MLKTNYRCRLFKTPLAAQLERRHIQGVLRYAFAALVVSASVQLVLLPLLIVYFHRLSFASLLLNVFVSGLMGLLSLIALVAIVVAQFSQAVAAPLAEIANGINWMMIHAVDAFEVFGNHALRLPEYSGTAALVYLIYYVPLTGLVWKLSRWQPVDLTMRRNDGLWSSTSRKLVGLQLMLGLVLVLHPLAARRADGRLYVDFLDVGQGDAAVVTMPDGTILLVDGGGRPNFRKSIDDGNEFDRDTRGIGDAVVSEYLWWRGLDHVDYILATHADADHIDGLNDVAMSFSVRSALVARAPDDDPEFVKFASTTTTRSIPVHVLGAGDVLEFNGVTASILWPPPNESTQAPSRNNDSLVMRLVLGRRSILMTGDVEREGEAAILRSGALLPSDVVKVPHHGSKTSSTSDFVSATQPCMAVISVGLRSMFGHPRPEVVDRWRAAGAEVKTTGRYGTITVSTDGSDLRVETFIK